MKRTQIIYLLGCVAILTASSCGGGEKKKKASTGESTKTQSASENAKFVNIEDATKWEDDWSKKNTVVVHNLGDPDNLHPSNGTAVFRRFIFFYTHNSLLEPDLENPSAVRPKLVKSLPEISEDELEFTYELKDEPTFDNGEQLTIDDVIFTFKANKSPLTNNPHAKPYLDYLKTIKVDPNNPRKFTLIMNKRYIQNIYFLTDYPIIQKSVFDPNGVLDQFTMEQLADKNFDSDAYPKLNEWAGIYNGVDNSRNPEHIVGLGPYQVVSWEAGQTLILEKKKTHWLQKLKKPLAAADNYYPEKIIFKINKDANSQMLEFKTQVYDASSYLSTSTLQELQKDENFNKNYHSKFIDSYNYTYVAMNMKPDGIKRKKYFTDKKVRKAMALLTPTDDLISVLSGGLNKRLIGPVSPLKTAEYNNDLELIPYDVEAAKTLLDEAGWKDTDNDGIRDKMIDGQKVQMSFEIMYMTTTVNWKKMAKLIAEAMKYAGVEANIKGSDFSVVVNRAREHDFDMFLGAWGGWSGPSDHGQLWKSTSWATKGSNYPGFGNAESDALIDSINVTLNDTKRAVLVKQLQALIYEEHPYVFLMSGIRRIAIHKRFGNANMYFDTPGLMINNLKLLYGNLGASQKSESSM